MVDNAGSAAKAPYHEQREKFCSAMKRTRDSELGAFLAKLTARALDTDAPYVLSVDIDSHSARRMLLEFIEFTECVASGIEVSRG
jgi:predicted amidophosphoribosyltransferase